MPTDTSPPEIDNSHLLDVVPLRTKSVELVLDTDTTLLPLAKAALAALFDQVELSKDDDGKPLQCSLFGLEEAFINAVIHGSAEDQGLGASPDHLARKVNVRMSVSEIPEETITRGSDDVRQSVVNILLRIEVENEGQEFDPDDIPDPTSSDETLLFEHGRGLKMMREVFCDVVDYPEEHKGRIAVLINAYRGKLLERKVRKREKMS